MHFNETCSEVSVGKFFNCAFPLASRSYQGTDLSVLIIILFLNMQIEENHMCRVFFLPNYRDFPILIHTVEFKRDCEGGGGQAIKNFCRVWN
jgi:hypothetical protein